MQLACLLTFILSLIVVTIFGCFNLQVAKLKMRGTQTWEYRVLYGFLSRIRRDVTREPE